jgi:hypothetical protein
MWYTWERNCTVFWWESRKEKDNLKDRVVDGNRMDLGMIDLGVVDWIQLAQGSGRCRAFVNAVMNVRVLAPRRQLIILSGLNSRL